MLMVEYFASGPMVRVYRNIDWSLDLLFLLVILGESHYVFFIIKEISEGLDIPVFCNKKRIPEE